MTLEKLYEALGGADEEADDINHQARNTQAELALMGRQPVYG